MYSKNISTWCKAKWEQFSDRPTTLLDWLITVSIIFFILVFVLAMSIPELSESIGWLLGTGNKKETLTFISIGIGGLVLWQRTRSTQEQAGAMVAATEHQAKANEITEAGHVQERLKIEK